MKSKRAKLIKNLDAITKGIVKQRDEFKCQKCGKVVSGSNCHWSHIIPVSHGNKLRWQVMNSLVLCYHHHINWAHKNPLEFTEWFKTEFPHRYEYLMMKVKKPVVPIKEFELEDILNNLKDLERRRDENINLN